MPDSIGRRLLRTLRIATELGPAPSVDAHMLEVDEEQLRTAAASARAGRKSAVQELSTLLIGADRTGDPSLAEFAIGLLADAEPVLWTSLDAAARRSWWDSRDWADQARDRVGRPEASTLALVLASFHPVGFVREVAVARLGEIDDAIALPVLALRAADWVPHVRDRARDAVARRAVSSVELLVGVGPLAVLLADRAQGGWLYRRLGASITSLDDEALRHVLAAPDRRLRRLGFSIALRDDRLGHRDLLDVALKDGDLVIRVQCADAAIRAALAAGSVDLVRPLTTSGTAAVRVVAVSALARAGAADIAEAALVDRNQSVREVAQAAFRRAGSDPAGRYRALVRALTPADPGAVAGLGETGTTPDVELVRRSLTDPRPRGRVEAVRAWRRLGSVDVPTLVTMLDDPSPAVTRHVVTTLAPRVDEIAASRLAQLLDPANRPHVRAAAYRLIRARGIWTRLLTDLELYEDDDENLRTRARGDLFAWLERDAATTYSTPAGTTAARLDVHLSRLAPSLGPTNVRLLRFHLGLTGRSGDD